MGRQLSNRGILIIDDDPATEEAMRAPLLAAGFEIDTAGDTLSAIGKLRQRPYAAVVLGLMIRHALNGFVVLDFIEQEKPSLLQTLFVFTGLSRQTVMRTAPSAAPRFFRKPHDAERLNHAVIEFCTRADHQATDRKFSVLLAEDDPRTAALETELLSALGFDCHWVADGADVLNVIESRDFAAIILDLMLPGVDGFHILDALRATQPDTLKRIIVVTGMPERYLAIDEREVCAVIQKPVALNTLLPLLERCCEASRLLAGLA
jgi:DNA-binding response OmpR family regulator